MVFDVFREYRNGRLSKNESKNSVSVQLKNKAQEVLESHWLTGWQLYVLRLKIRDSHFSRKTCKLMSKYLWEGRSGRETPLFHYGLSLPLLSCESSLYVKEYPYRKKTTLNITNNVVDLISRLWYHKRILVN